MLCRYQSSRTNGMADARTNDPAANNALRKQLADGFQFLQQGRLEEAAGLSAVLLATHPRNAETLYLASEVRLAEGEVEAALEWLSAAIEAAPGQLPLLLKQANHLLLLRRRAQAREVAASAAQIVGLDGDALLAIGRVYSKCDDPLSARTLYERARAAGCRDPSLHYDLAATQFFIGEFQQAEQNLDALLQRVPTSGRGWYLRSTLRRQTEASNHVADLQARLAAGLPDAANRSACLYALAKELEDLGQDEQSFGTLVEAATLKRSTLRYDAAAERETIDAIRTRFDASVMQAHSQGHADDGPIFIVGMPRTGTTLVERMLGRHSEVRSAGELLDFGLALAAAAGKRAANHPGLGRVEAATSIDFADLGRDYATSAREAAAGSHRFIDKMPINYMYCGLIRKALPNARLIHLVRDPVDSCYAVYKTLFNQAYHFSYDLAELADYYVTYHRMMRHWHAVMPGAILDVRYEALVSDTDTQARRILEWCGLDWQAGVMVPSQNEAPSTTASAAQVREPVHSRSVGRSRVHAEGLAPLRARLVAAGIIDAEA
jgi:tetratricopeptide (TPR) repeat protein